MEVGSALHRVVRNPVSLVIALAYIVLIRWHALRLVSVLRRQGGCVFMTKRYIISLMFASEFDLQLV